MCSSDLDTPAVPSGGGGGSSNDLPWGRREDEDEREWHFVTSPQAVGFYRKMGAVRDGETRSPVDGRPVPHFVYDV